METLAKNLADTGAVSLQDFLADCIAPSTTTNELVDLNPVTRLHQACQRAFHSTNPAKFEFIDHAGSRNKQCILTIIRPDGVRRSYATQPVFAKKNEAKLEAAKVAIDMGVLDFLVSDQPCPSAVATCPDNAAVSSLVDDIERCCIEWRAGCVIPHWIPFSDPKLVHKQGCALRIQLSPHLVRVYLADPTFDTHLDAKGACAKVAVLEGVLDFIKHGNGQTHPASPIPSPQSAPPRTATTPWTLQAFYQSLPRPFPESFEVDEASGINAPGWLNTLVQNARGGKLILSFFFTSDGPPGLHGCLLKLDRPGEYKASLVDARFLKRSDAKAAVCLQAMSDGISNYIRSITSVIDTKITHTMRSFSSGLVYPALMSELNKIAANLHPHFEYDKERDAFGACLVVRLSTSPTSDQIRRYTVPSDYRNKADAKVGVICHAAEHGVVEFVRFRGGAPPDGYTSPYTLHTYNPDASRKRKQPGSTEDAEHGRPAKKKKKKGKWQTEAEGEVSHLTPVGQFLSTPLSSNQMHDTSEPGDMGLLQSVPTDNLCDPSQPGVGSGSGSGATRPTVYGHGQTYPSYPAVLDPRFVGNGGPDGLAYGLYPHDSGSRLPLPSEAGPSRTRLGNSLHSLHRPIESTELEPGEVVSSAESEFSESSSRNEDAEVPMPATGKERDTSRNNEEHVSQGSIDKGKAKEASPANTSTTVSRDGPGATTTTSHVKKLLDYCALHCCSTPSFHETQQQDRFQVWIVIGKERFDLPTTYGSAEEGRERIAKQVLARLSTGP